MPPTHRHDWHVTQYLLLSLPTHDGFADRVTQWQCRTCPVYCVITGHVRLGTPLESPPYWDYWAAREQRQGTPAARMAQQHGGYRLDARREPR
jgi:hypothetical protein